MTSSNEPTPAAVQPPEAVPAAPYIRTVVARVRARLAAAEHPEAAITLTFSPRTITLDMIRDTFRGVEDRFPPIISLEQAADLVGYQEQTLRKHLSEGKYARSSRRGHPVRFMRDVFVLEFMSGGLK